MLFTSAEHGCSLKTFYGKAGEHEPMVLLIKTVEGEVKYDRLYINNILLFNTFISLAIVA